LETPKDIRASAVKKACDAYITNLKKMRKGKLRFFRMKHNEDAHPTICIPSATLRIQEEGVPTKEQVIKKENVICFFEKEFKKRGVMSTFHMGKRTLKKHKNLDFRHDCELTYRHGEFWLMVPVKVVVPPKKTPETYTGIDPGVRTFMTTFGNDGCKEFQHNQAVFDRLNKKLESCASKRRGKHSGARIKKKYFYRYEKRKWNLIQELHHSVAGSLLKSYDVLFYGNIQSHGVVRNRRNRKVSNQRIQDLKFYKFRMILQSKAEQLGKRVVLVDEKYTTKTCSFCGMLNEVGCSKIYSCDGCQRKVGRDVNASKNILMKGIEQVRNAVKHPPKPTEVK
jgi:IS605 OrfB family transposase